MKFLMKQQTAKRVASLRPSSGLILGKATGSGSEAASVCGPRTSGVAALMAVAPRGRVPDACGAIVARAASAPRAAPHNTSAGTSGAPGTRLHRSDTHGNHRPSSDPTPGDDCDGYRSRRRACVARPRRCPPPSPQTSSMRNARQITRKNHGQNRYMQIDILRIANGL